MPWNNAKRWPWKTDAEYNQHWLERVRANADRNESGCLISRTKHLSVSGYPQVNHRKKTVRIHRRMFEIVHGETLPPTIDVCHSCDNRRCIEIDHLWAGTRKQNVDDMTAKARHWSKVKTHCKHGHPFTPENTEIRQSRGKPGQGRACKTCCRIKGRMKAGWTREEAESLDGYGSGDGDGYGYGSGSYWLATIQYFAGKWTDLQRSRLAALKDAGAKIAFWRSSENGTPANGGKSKPVAPGLVQEEKGPLRDECGRGQLHATLIPTKWQGERWWVVALIGEVRGDEEKFWALKREIIGECE